MSKTFLCHAGEDKAQVVEPLYRHLRDIGIPTWYDRAELSWGDSLTEKINQGLSESDHVIVILSEHFLTKNWPQRELHSVLNADATSGSPSILPLIVGHDSTVDKILAAYPLLHDKYYLRWDNTPIEQIGYELTRLTREGLHERNTEPEPPKSETETLGSIFELKAEHYLIEQLPTGGQFGILLDPAFLGNTSIHREQLRLLNESQQYGLYSSLFWSLGRSIARGDDMINRGAPIFVPIDVESSIFPSTLDSLVSCAKKWGVSPNRITVLVPEPMMNTLDDPASIFRSDRWNNLQFGLAEFGTGYTSLSYLKSLPFQYLFIAQAFVNEAYDDSTASAIVRTVGELGRSLGMTVIATLPSIHWPSGRLCDHKVDLAVHARPGDDIPNYRR